MSGDLGGANARIAAAATVFIAAALAGGPSVSAPYCPGHPQPARVPAALVSAVAQAFAIPDEAARDALARCVGSKLLACTVGANLNCGKADARRSLPGATAYCRENPNSDFIPMYATGHATIYAWRCAGGRALPDKAVATVDPQGYMAENWKEVR